MKYLVIIEKGSSNYGAHVPDLPGCVAHADTEEEVSRAVQEAIELHLKDMRETGQEIPEPSTSARYFEAVS